MDAKKFLEALNEIDDLYIEKADLFTPEEAVRRPALLRVLSWAAPAAACLLAAVGLLFLSSSSLFDSSPVASEPEAMPSPTAAPFVPGVTSSAEGLVPLEDLPQLSFPSEEEFWNMPAQEDPKGSPASEGDIYDQIHGSETRSLSEEMISSIWGQEDSLYWEGLNVSEDYKLEGEAYYDKNGDPVGAMILGYYRPAMENSLNPAFSLFFGVEPGGTPLTGYEPYLGIAHQNDVWGTDVSTVAVYWDGSYVAGFEREDPSGGKIGALMLAQAAENGLAAEQAKELLTRFASHSLRPENTLQLSQLEENFPLSSAPPASVPDALSAEMAQAAKDIAQEWISLESENCDKAGAPLAEIFCDKLCITQVDIYEGFVLRFQQVFRPADPESSYWQGSDIEPGVGKYEGYLTSEQQVAARKVGEKEWFLESGGSSAVLSEPSAQVEWWVEHWRDQEHTEAELEEAAQAIADEYAKQMKELAEPGYPALTECFFDIDGYDANAEYQDSDMQVCGRLVFQVENSQGLEYPEVLGNWTAGNTKPGSGQYEGYYTAFRFVYAKWENGSWKIVSSGTGP